MQARYSIWFKKAVISCYILRGPCRYCTQADDDKSARDTGCVALKCSCAETLYPARRPKYDEVLKTLGVRPLKMQAARGVMVKLTAEDQPTVLVGENVDEAPAI